MPLSSSRSSRDRHRHPAPSRACCTAMWLGLDAGAPSRWSSSQLRRRTSRLSPARADARTSPALGRAAPHLQSLTAAVTSFPPIALGDANPAHTTTPPGSRSTLTLAPDATVAAHRISPRPPYERPQGSSDPSQAGRGHGRASPASSGRAAASGRRAQPRGAGPCSRVGDREPIVPATRSSGQRRTGSPPTPPSPDHIYPDLAPRRRQAGIAEFMPSSSTGTGQGRPLTASTAADANAEARSRRSSTHARISRLRAIGMIR